MAAMAAMAAMTAMAESELSRATLQPCQARAIAV